MTRYKLWLLYSKLTKNNIIVYEIKTDCVLVRESKEEPSKIIKFNNKIGGYKFETNKIPIDKKITLIFNKLIEFKQSEANIIQMNDQYDVNQMRTILQNNNIGVLKYICGFRWKTDWFKKQWLQSILIYTI